MNYVIHRISNDNYKDWEKTRKPHSYQSAFQSVAENDEEAYRQAKGANQLCSRLLLLELGNNRKAIEILGRKRENTLFTGIHMWN
jgi:hypothetical protein